MISSKTGGRITKAFAETSCFVHENFTTQNSAKCLKRIEELLITKFLGDMINK